MTAVTRVAAIRDRHDRLLIAGVIATGSGLLVLRLAVMGSPSATVLFAATYLGLGAASLAVPLPPSTAGSLRAPVVAVVGVAAIAVAALLGARFPVPHGPEVLALNSLAAVAEEAFFRRLVYGGLVRWGAGIAVCGSALLFASVHVPIYGPAAFWVDLGAGLLLSWQRWASGNWAAPAATHVVANLLAVLR